MRYSLMLLAFGILGSHLHAGERKSLVIREVSHTLATGNIEADFFGSHDFTQGPKFDSHEGIVFPRKSPWLAAGLSLIVPGAGEFYAESYWKAAAFFAIGVTAWTISIVQDSKGDKQTASFQRFADQNWSVVQYAEFSWQNHLTPEQQATFATWRVPGTENRSPFDRPWEQVNWTVINAMERVIGGTGPGRYYSHTLPRYGEQQYYELIGKYPQYNQGWIDAQPGWVYDPNNEGNVTPNFGYYSGERGKANDFYSNASTAVTIAVVNHILSAADAAWSASTHNRLHAQIGLQAVPGQRNPEKAAVLFLRYDL